MSLAEFEIQESLVDGWLRLTLFGEMDMSTSPELEARLGELQGERRSVLVDLSQLEFMDSSGLGVIVRAINASRTDGWAFEIDPNLSPQVRRLFGLAAVAQFAGIDGHEPSAA